MYSQDLMYSKGLSSNNSESDSYSFNYSNFYEDGTSSVAFIESSHYEVSKLEAYLYYFDIWGESGDRL